ncbi:glycosyltransferase family 39 protein [Patescibacteria group bacterium]|nr:glycosyltransferase family 39 protein [Patescibacteria group bacterium]
MKIAKTNLTLIAILVIGLILRLYNLIAVSLWHDEAFSALLIRYPFGEMIARIILDVHPPLYYIILRVWDILLGDSLLSLRLFSAFFGVLTIYFTYLFVKTAFKNEKLSLISAAFIAINPFQIQYATEARMYTLGTFLIVLSSWLLAKAIETRSASEKEIFKNAYLTDEKSTARGILAKLAIKIKKYKWWILYGISAALAIYTHYYLIFSVAAQALFAVLLVLKNHGLKIKEWAKSENIKGALIAYIISFIIFLPWLPVLVKQLSQVEENYWIPAMDRYSIPNTILHLFTGANIYASNANLIIISLAFLIILALALKREKNIYKWLAFFSFLIPFIISVILSLKRSLYLDRYFVFVGLFYFIILAIFLESIKKRILQNILLGVLAIGSILLFAKGWQNASPAGKPGMAGASEYLFQNVKPEDKVYINSSFIFFTYKHYAYRNYFGGAYPSNFNPSEMIQENNVFDDYRVYPEYLTPLLYTPGLTALSQIPHFSGTALLTDCDLLTDFNKNLRRSETIWLIWTTGFGSGKPEIPLNWMQTDEAGFQDVFDYRGWIVVTKYKVQ